jgi:hypothetical protein
MIDKDAKKTLNESVALCDKLNRGDTERTMQLHCLISADTRQKLRTLSFAQDVFIGDVVNVAVEQYWNRIMEENTNESTC